jgi:predicted RNA binding protein YcfA (HicA-like mRNA interferase family)
LGAGDAAPGGAFDLRKTLPRLHDLLALHQARLYVSACMNSKQKRTLEAVFSEPTLRTLEWSAIESLLIAVGCRVVEGKGSAVKFEHDDLVVRFHRPHPGKEAKPYQAKDARLFLRKIGIAP